MLRSAPPSASSRRITLAFLAFFALFATPVRSVGSSITPKRPNPLFHRFRAQQSFFCSRIYPTIRDYPPSFTHLANLSANFGTPQFDIYVYEGDDIVSQYIRKHGNWEPTQVKLSLDLLEEYRVAHDLKKKDITFLDIGSNVGVFALSIAMAGYKVIAFEPMQRNEMMLRSSICANNLMDRITYINLGLSSQRDTCSMISAKHNSGNGIVLCGDKTVPDGFEVRSTIQITRIDTVIPPNVARQLRIPVFKMDTEGLEAMVLQGGPHFFAKPELRHGFLEFNTETQNHTHALADELKHLGFRVSVKGMKEEEYDVKTDPTFYAPAVRDAYAWRP